MGFELGAVTITMGLTFGLVIVGAAVGLVLTAPDFAVFELIVALVAIAVVVPIAVYPSSYTLWQAIDLAMRPPAPGELPTPPMTRSR